MHLTEEKINASLILHTLKSFHSLYLSWWGERQSSLSLCRRLLAAPFSVLLFRKVTAPPSSPPSEVMTRSLNLCLGSGGSGSGGAPTLSSTWGSCRSTLALRKETRVSSVCAFPSPPLVHPLGHSLGVFLLLDLLPGPVWVCGFFPFGLRYRLLLLLLRLLWFCWAALDLHLHLRVLNQRFGNIVTGTLSAFLLWGCGVSFPLLENKNRELQNAADQNSTENFDIKCSCAVILVK